MRETFTLSLRFAGVDQLAKQAEACTPTTELNATQTAITGGTFEQQWGLDALATGRHSTWKQPNTSSD